MTDATVETIMEGLGFGHLFKEYCIRSVTIHLMIYNIVVVLVFKYNSKHNWFDHLSLEYHFIKWQH